MPKLTPSHIAREIIALLKEKDSYDQLPAIAHLLQEEAQRNQDIHVISAVPMSEKEQKEVHQQLAKEWGEHPLVVTVDPVLVSGMVIKFQDKIIDLSGKHALQDLKNALVA